MPMPVITITKRKNGQAVASFRDDAGRRVRTSTRVIGGGWVRAEMVKDLADYGIALQLGQCAAGLGSDGAPMPGLKNGGRAVFAGRVNGRATFVRQGYPAAKVKLGLQPIRDLRGPGIGGHMLDDVRINYLDDTKATFAITTRMGRTKALANEQRAQWWGWSPASYVLLIIRAAEIFNAGTADYLVSLGLIAANQVAGLRRSVLRRAA